MHEIAVEHHHTARLAGGRHDAAFSNKFLNGCVVERPQRIAGGAEVVAGIEIAVLLRARHQHQRAVVGIDLVEEHRDIHRPRLRHAVVAQPRAIVLMPLPNVAVELRLRVDLVLVHVELLAKHLFDGLDQPRVTAEQAEGFVVRVGGKCGARGTGLLAPDFGPVRR